jgi:hypothetical protein
MMQDVLHQMIESEIKSIIQKEGTGRDREGFAHN